METTLSPTAPVVVGVDGSTASERAARWAAVEAAAWGVPLQLVSVWSMPASDWPYAGSPAYLAPDVVRETSEHILEQTADALRTELGAGAPEIESLTPEGQPAHELLELGREARALTVGTRGRGGFTELLMGSVATACIHHATCPVVVVGEHLALPGSGPVVVGVDNSDGARAALRWAAREARRLDVRLVVVHGWELPDVAPPGPVTFGPTVDEDFTATADRFLGEFVDEALADEDGLPEIDPRSVPAAAVEALRREATGAGLLVVGSRGRGGFTGLLLGSVSRQCAHHAPCPVAIVPR